MHPERRSRPANRSHLRSVHEAIASGTIASGFTLRPRCLVMPRKQRRPSSATPASVRMQVDLVITSGSAPLERFFARASHRDRQAEHSADSGCLYTAETGDASADRIGGYAPLPIDGTSQRSHAPLPGHEIGDTCFVTGNLFQAFLSRNQPGAQIETLNWRFFPALVPTPADAYSPLSSASKLCGPPAHRHPSAM